MSKLPLFLVAFLAAAAPGTAGATLDCSKVATFADTDPDGALFGNRLRDEVAINGNGDVLFLERPLGATDRLYLYSATGTKEIVVEGGTSAPGGGIFGSKLFVDPSLDEAGDLAFHAEVDDGAGIYARAAGQPLALVARTSDASPAGGTFTGFPALSRVNAARQIAFIAEVSGGLSGVFVYDVAGGGPVSSAVLVGAPTTGGRSLCAVFDLDLAGNGDLALRGEAKTTCGAAETALEGVFHVSGSTIREVALVGASPAPGVAYLGFDESPAVNTSGHVAFEANVAGSTGKTALLRWDGATTTLATQGDFSAETGGFYRDFRDLDLHDGGEVVVNVWFKKGDFNNAIIQFDPASSALVTKADAPPSPFPPGATYRRIRKVIETSEIGGHLVFTAEVKDTVAPRIKKTVVRCAPSL